MKIKHIIGCFAALALATTSCQDFLTEEPQGKLTPESYFSTQSELDMSVNALYAQVNRSQIYTNMQIPQWQGDDMTANPGSNKQAYAECDRFDVTDNNKGVKECWSTHYGIIKAANLIIDNATKTPVDQKEVDIAIGQAKYWRAYAYFTLVRLYGELPINLHNEADGNATQLSSIEDVYKVIVKDLEDCAALGLPRSYADYDAPRTLFGVDTYVTDAAVQATLSAVYMAMAGEPLNKGTEYYAKAAAAAKNVIDHKAQDGFVIDPDWKQVYSYGNNYNKETVLGLNFSPLEDWSADSELASSDAFESVGGWGDAWGAYKFWVEMPEGPRKDCVYSPMVRLKSGECVDWWATTDGEAYNGSNACVPEFHPEFANFTINAHLDGWDGNLLKQPYDYTQPFYQRACTDTRHFIIRYPEVELWYAESAARSGGDLTLAKQCLKNVRSRAVSDPALISAIDGMNADQLAEAAYQEHGWEVAGYWVALVTRRHDMLRRGKFEEYHKYRSGAQETVIVPAGTLTHAVDAEGKPFTYTLKADLKAKESNPVTAPWKGNQSIYMPYPGNDVEKNGNLKR